MRTDATWLAWHRSPPPRRSQAASGAHQERPRRSEDRKGGAMLTKEQNKRFTEVGPSKPMGELMRRYWLPFATVGQFHQHPTRAITLLGEHLVAFRDRSGRYGLIQEYCPHRNVNLLWGIPEPEGLRCPYHGWLYDNQGNCLDQPAESPDSTFKDRIKIKSYPVEELGGMLYAWLGPEPRPLVPRWE